MQGSFMLQQVVCTVQTVQPICSAYTWNLGELTPRTE